MNSYNLPQSDSSGIPGKVLVVDDEPSILAIASAILRTVEVTPLRAQSGEEAVDIARAETNAGAKISIVIQDLTLPGGMSGFETMEAVRAIDPGIRVIACSGFLQEDAYTLCRSIGFANVLAKPYTPESLLGTIRETLESDNPPLQPKAAQNPEPFQSSSSFFAAPDHSSSQVPAGLNAFVEDEDDDDDHDVDFNEPENVEANAAGWDQDDTCQPGSEETGELVLAATAVMESADDVLAEETVSKATTPRRPSFLASALAKSMRSRLLPFRGRASKTPAAESSPE